MTLNEIRMIGTTDGDGDLTLTAPRSVFGHLDAVEWIDGDFADGVDAVLSVTLTPSGVDRTLLTLTNANDDKWYHPRTLVQTEAGADLTGTSGGDREKMIIAGTLKLVISSGGATKTGGAIIYYHD